MEDLKCLWLVTSKFLAKPADAAVSFLGSLLYLKIIECVDYDFLRPHCLYCWFRKGREELKVKLFSDLSQK